MAEAGKNDLAREEGLLDRLIAGDSKAYEALYHRHYYFVFRFARQFTDDRAAAEDIATDVFIKLWDKRTSFQARPGIKPFLFSAVRNACLNYLRDKKRHSHIHRQLAIQTSVNALTDEPHQVIEQVYQHLEAAINTLSPKMKTILKQHLEGIKNEHIARDLNLSEKTIRNLKVEAIKLLKISFLKSDLLLLLLTLPHYWL